MPRKVRFVLLLVMLCSLVCSSLGLMEDEDVAEIIGEERGRRKSKIMLPLLFAALLIKSIIFPLAYKSMAIMTAVTIFISGLSLILSGISGYKKIADGIAQPYKRIFDVQEKTEPLFSNHRNTIKPVHEHEAIPPYINYNYPKY